jgi:hypothetical protein
MGGPLGNGGKGKNKKPPNFLEGPAQSAVGAAMPGLTAGLAKGASFDPSTNIQNSINANYAQATSRLDPQWQQRQQAFGSQMANQGLDPGTQAYDASAGTLNRAQNDAYATAMRNAIGQGNQTALVGMQGAMLPFNQFSTLMHGAQPGAQQGLDVYNAGQAQQQGKKNGAATMAPFLMGGGGASPAAAGVLV